MSAHTPGPWAWVGTRKRPQSFCYLQGQRHEPVGVSIDGFTDNTDNARLIAAAPELLAALQECQRFIDYSRDHCLTGSEIDVIISTTKAAIAKATGKETV